MQPQLHKSNHNVREYSLCGFLFLYSGDLFFNFDLATKKKKKKRKIFLKTVADFSLWGLFLACKDFVCTGVGKQLHSNLGELKGFSWEVLANKQCYHQKNLKQSWLPVFWKKTQIQNTSEIKRTLFKWTKQNKTCTFFRKSSFSSYTQQKNRKTNNQFNLSCVS